MVSGELPAADAAEYVRARMNTVPRPYQVEVLVNAPAATVQERIGRWSVVEEVDGDHSRVRMTTDSLDWPTMALGSLGADFRVIEPPELLDQLAEWATRFNRAVQQA